MNPADPKNWRFIIDESAYTRKAICSQFGVKRTWLRRRKPKGVARKQWIEQMTNIMCVVQSTPKIKRHPSFGYATPEQIEKLRGGAIPPVFNAVMEEIKKQSQNEGKLFT